jgi:hypothetical protein
VRHKDVPGQLELVLRLEGRFDRDAAAALRRVVEQLPPDSVLLDFSKVRDFLDLAVPDLTRNLEGRGVQVMGLPHHLERMFRYFGWCKSEATDPAYYVPEDSLAS